ncbi:predicted protein [Histoplasma capsulatum H143]|uniref:Uncharacterized protein n=1 Tax=Ajellomyces capsulatus (strain H143) TaxID=544712 RepID=C6HS54_AJECH|nr:predicted protein [Histoplasma capsulatum H143]
MKFTLLATLALIGTALALWKEMQTRWEHGLLRERLLRGLFYSSAPRVVKFGDRLKPDPLIKLPATSKGGNRHMRGPEALSRSMWISSSYPELLWTFMVMSKSMNSAYNRVHVLCHSNMYSESRRYAPERSFNYPCNHRNWNREVKLWVRGSIG